MRVSVFLKRSFRVLVILPLTITGLTAMCVAVLSMCLSSLTVLSSALKTGDPQYAESRFLSSQFLLLRDDLLHDMTASLTDSLYDAAARLADAHNVLRRDIPLVRHDIPLVSRDLPFVMGDIPLVRRDIHLIRFDAPTLAPMAFTQFCLKYANECKPQRQGFRDSRLKLTNQRWAELVAVNRTVNSSILPERNNEGLAGEKWLLGPVLGDCNDYAVTKRHQLIARGWPAGAVLLSEVVTVSGEHHLVAVVRTDDGDLVLDNLTDRIMPWSSKPYQWVRIQTPGNPNYWVSISAQNA